MRNQCGTLRKNSYGLWFDFGNTSNLGVYLHRNTGLIGSFGAILNVHRCQYGGGFRAVPSGFVQPCFRGARNTRIAPPTDATDQVKCISPCWLNLWIPSMNHVLRTQKTARALSASRLTQKRVMPRPRNIIVSRIVPHILRWRGARDANKVRWRRGDRYERDGQRPTQQRRASQIRPEGARSLPGAFSPWLAHLDEVARRANEPPRFIRPPGGKTSEPTTRD